MACFSLWCGNRRQGERQKYLLVSVVTDQEINLAVARGLGWEVRSPSRCEDNKPEHIHISDPSRGIWCLPNYCHSIEAAWEIMEYLAPKYFGISIGHGTNPDFWQCEIHGKGWEKVYERADTAPMAICLAFLKLEKSSPARG